MGDFDRLNLNLASATEEADKEYEAAKEAERKRLRTTADAYGNLAQEASDASTKSGHLSPTEAIFSTLATFLPIGIGYGIAGKEGALAGSKSSIQVSKGIGDEILEDSKTQNKFAQELSKKYVDKQENALSDLAGIEKQELSLQGQFSNNLKMEPFRLERAKARASAQAASLGDMLGIPGSAPSAPSGTTTEPPLGGPYNFDDVDPAALANPDTKAALGAALQSEGIATGELKSDIIPPPLKTESRLNEQVVGDSATGKVKENPDIRVAKAFLNIGAKDVMNLDPRDVQRLGYIQKTFTDIKEMEALGGALLPPQFITEIKANREAYSDLLALRILAENMTPEGEGGVAWERAKNAGIFPGLEAEGNDQAFGFMGKTAGRLMSEPQTSDYEFYSRAKVTAKKFASTTEPGGRLSNQDFEIIQPLFLGEALKDKKEVIKARLDAALDKLESTYDTNAAQFSQSGYGLNQIDKASITPKSPVYSVNRDRQELQKLRVLKEQRIRQGQGLPQ